MQFPKKSDCRPRAHCNPFADKYMFIPESPESIEWSEYYTNSAAPEFLDLGCGFGSFMIEIAKVIPNKNIIGIEIRKKVAEFVSKKIDFYRKQENSCNNLAVINTNGMIFSQNIFLKNSLEKIFILFPDPQFKKKKHKARIVCKQMISLYVYLLKKGGRIYISTDVSSLFDSMVESLKTSKFLRELTLCESENDILYKMTYDSTDEAKRAGMKTGTTYATIFEKIETDF